MGCEPVLVAYSFKVVLYHFDIISGDAMASTELRFTTVLEGINSMMDSK
jgi:hypothetical protein